MERFFGPFVALWTLIRTRYLPKKTDTVKQKIKTNTLFTRERLKKVDRVIENYYT